MRLAVWTFGWALLVAWRAGGRSIHLATDDAYNPTGQPTSIPSGQPSSVPTSLPSYQTSLVIDVDVSLGDLPLVAGSTYDCGGVGGVTVSTSSVATTTVKRAKKGTVTNLRPCIFRAAVAACINQPGWRGSFIRSRCTVLFPPEGVNNTAPIMYMYPQPIQIPTTKGLYFDLVIDASGWTFFPGFVSVSLNQPQIGTYPAWYTWQFLTTLDPRKSAALEVRATAGNFFGASGRAATRARARRTRELASSGRGGRGTAVAVAGAVLGAGAGKVNANNTSASASASVSADEMLWYDEPISPPDPDAEGGGRYDMNGDETKLGADSEEGWDRQLASARKSVQSTFLLRNTSFELRNATFRRFGFVDRRALLGDYVDQFNGGVAHVSDIGLVTFADVTFDTNLGIKGGALFINRTSMLTIVNCSFSGNAAFSAGAIYGANIGSVVVTGTDFSRNRATKYQGGGTYLRFVDSISMQYTSFSLNVAAAYGIETGSRSYKFGGFGGGAAFADVFSLLLVNCSFSNNTAHHGGGVTLGATVPTVTAARMQTNFVWCTFLGNAAAVAGGAIYWIASSGMPAPRRVQTCAFLGNTAIYGPRFATEAIKLSPTPNVFYIRDYQNREVLTGDVAIYDYYNQLVLADSGDLVNIVKVPGKSQAACQYNEQIVQVTGATQSATKGGRAHFAGWGAGGCIPSKFINATYSVEAQLSQMAFPQETDVTQYSKKTYQLQTDVIVWFRPCGVGEYYDYGKGLRDQCAVCQDGYSFVDNKDNIVISCMTCPPLASYCYSDQIVLAPGTWRWGSRATTILPCPFGAYACRGGNTTGTASCNRGYHGPVCGICDWQYYSKSYQCMDCAKVNPYDPQTLTILAFLLASIVGYSVTVVRRYARKHNVPWYKFFTRFFAITYKKELGEDMETAFDRREKAKTRAFMVRLKIVIATYQVILQSPTIFNIKMGPLFQAMVNFLSFLNFDIFQIIPLQCLQPFAYIESMISATLMPVAASSFLFVLYLVQRIHILALEPNRVIRRDKLKKLFGRYFTVFISFTYMILPSTCMKILKTFECQDIDPNKESTDPNAPHIFLRMDFAVDCETSKYHFGYLWALAMVGVYVVGLPMSNFLMVFLNRREVQSRMTKMHMMRELDDMCDATPEELEEYIKTQERKKNRTGGVANTAFTEGIQFLWAAYKAEYWFWELIETYRRLSCTSILATFFVQTPQQCVFGTLLSIFYVKLYTSCKPYFDPFDNMMAEFGHYQIFFTFFSIYIMRMRSLGNSEATYYLLDTMVVGINTLVVGSFLSTVLQEYLLYLARLRKIRGGLPDDAIPRAFRTVRTVEQDMQLVLTALKRNPKVLEQIGQSMEKKVGDRATEKRGALVMSASSLQQLLLSKAKRREGVSMTAEQFQALMVSNAKAKKKASGLGLDAAKLRELEAIEDASQDDDSDDSDAESEDSDEEDEDSDSDDDSSGGEGSGPAYSATDSEEEEDAGPDADQYSDTDDDGSDDDSDLDSEEREERERQRKARADRKKGAAVKVALQAKGAPKQRPGIRVRPSSDSASGDDSGGDDSEAGSHEGAYVFKAPQYSDDGSSSSSSFSDVEEARRGGSGGGGRGPRRRAGQGSDSSSSDSGDAVQIRVAQPPSVARSAKSDERASSLLSRFDRLLGRK